MRAIAAQLRRHRPTSLFCPSCPDIHSSGPGVRHRSTTAHAPAEAQLLCHQLQLPRPGRDSAAVGGLECGRASVAEDRRARHWHYMLYSPAQVLFLRLAVEEKKTPSHIALPADSARRCAGFPPVVVAMAMKAFHRRDLVHSAPHRTPSDTPWTQPGQAIRRPSHIPPPPKPVPQKCLFAAHSPARTAMQRRTPEAAGRPKPTATGAVVTPGQAGKQVRSLAICSRRILPHRRPIANTPDRKRAACLEVQSPAPWRLRTVEGSGLTCIATAACRTSLCPPARPPRRTHGQERPHRGRSGHSRHPQLAPFCAAPAGNAQHRVGRQSMLPSAHIRLHCGARTEHCRPPAAADPHGNTHLPRETAQPAIRAAVIVVPADDKGSPQTRRPNSRPNSRTSPAAWKQTTELQRDSPSPLSPRASSPRTPARSRPADSTTNPVPSSAPPSPPVPDDPSPPPSGLSPTYTLPQLSPYTFPPTKRAKQKKKKTKDSSRDADAVE